MRLLSAASVIVAACLGIMVFGAGGTNKLDSELQFVFLRGKDKSRVSVFALEESARMHLRSRYPDFPRTNHFESIHLDFVKSKPVLFIYYGGGYGNKFWTIEITSEGTVKSMQTGISVGDAVKP